MPQLVQIAHHVQRANDVVLNLERRSLHLPAGSVHHDTRQPIMATKRNLKSLRYPLRTASTQEPGRLVGAVDHVQRCPHFAAAIRDDADVGREQLL
jgi:hypothetical protein